MQRDYTKGWEDRLVEISTAENKREGKDFLTVIGSGLGDAANNFAISVGLLKADGALFDFNGDVKAYQKRVVDAKNMKAGEIRRIFEDCRSTDGTRGEDMKAASDDLNVVALGLADLAKIIDPTTNKLSTAAMSGVKDGVKKKMETVRHDSKARLDRNFSTMEELQAKEAAKELLMDAIDCVVDVCSIVADAASGNVVGAVMDCYDLVNHATGLCYDANALGNIYASSQLGDSDQNNAARRLQLLEEADRMRQTDDLSDAFHNIGEDMAGTGAGTFFSSLGTVMDVADTAKAGYDIYSMGKSTVDKFKEGGVKDALNPFTKGFDEEGTKAKIKKANMGMRRAKGEHLKDLQDTKKTLENTKRIKNFTNTKAVLKDTKIGLEIAGATPEHNFVGKTIEQTVPGKFIGKFKKFVDNGIDAGEGGAEILLDVMLSEDDKPAETPPVDWSDFEFEEPEA